MTLTQHTSCIRRIVLEFTTRCNLRCSYCLKSQPDHNVWTELPEAILQSSITALTASRTDYVCVNGHGETTMYENWNKYCDRMLDAGIHLGIISNFAKQFNEQELKTLSRFTHVEISCDTADTELFRKLRRGAELNTLLQNMLLVRSIAEKEGREPPKYTWSCLLSDQNIKGLQEYVILGLQYGISGFNFCNLVKYPDVNGALAVRHITELPDEQFLDAFSLFGSVIRVLREKHIQVNAAQGLTDSMLKRFQIINGEEASFRTDDLAVRRYAALSKPENHTRDCLEPWYNLFIHADGSVSPCCSHSPCATITPKGSLVDCCTTEAMVQIRQNLLTGELDQECLQCPVAGWVPIELFREKVKEMQAEFSGARC